MLQYIIDIEELARIGISQAAIRKAYGHIKESAKRVQFPVMGSRMEQNRV